MADKRCSKCREMKPVGEFVKHAGRPDGLSCWCKGCRRESDRRYWSSDRGKAKRKEYSESEKTKAYRRRWCGPFPSV